LAYVIAQPCIGVKDQACLDVCPVDCIHGEETDEQLYINPDDCINCGACEAVCPVEAIFEESMLPEKWQEFLERNRRYFED